MPLPLEGIVVVAVEQAIAGPVCSAHLAHAGARVIKIERPSGDFARRYDRMRPDASTHFAWANPGKESVVLDFARPRDMAILEQLVSEADVFVQNLGPGAADRLGFGPERLMSRWPTLVSLHISAFGDDPATAHGRRKGYDFLVQCEVGLAAATGAAEAPGRVGVSVCDVACGLYGYAAVLEALFERTRSGRGQAIRLSLFDCMAYWMGPLLLQWEELGRRPERTGLSHPTITPYGVFRCGDGEDVVLAVQNEREWRAFCDRVLDAPGLLADASLTENAGRAAQRGPIEAHIRAVFSGSTGAEIRARLDAAGIAWATFNDVTELARHALLRREVVDCGETPLSLAAPPLARPGVGRTRRVPMLGEDTARIIESLPPQTRGAGRQV